MIFRILIPSLFLGVSSYLYFFSVDKIRKSLDKILDMEYTLDRWFLKNPPLTVASGVFLSAYASLVFSLRELSLFFPHLVIIVLIYLCMIVLNSFVLGSRIEKAYPICKPILILINLSPIAVFLILIYNILKTGVEIYV